MSPRSLAAKPSRTPPSPIPADLRPTVRQARGLSADTRKYLSHSPEGELFRSHLTLFQRREMDATGFIPVRGSEGGEYYVGVWPDARMNRVWTRRPNGGLGKHWCLLIAGVGDFDAIIAKVLLLQADEKKFLRTAY